MIESLYKFINRIYVSILLLISEWYNYWRRALRYYFPEQSVLIFDQKTGKFIDYYYRFQLIKYIYNFANYFNVDGSKAHLVVNDKVINKKAVIENDDVSITNLVNKSNELLYHKKDMLSLMIMKLEFKKGVEKVCLKETFKDYLHSEKHQNTLHNIFLFNNIDYDDKDEIYIKFFKNGKQEEKTIKMREYKNKHLKELFDT